MAFTIILTIVGLVLLLAEIFLIPGVGVAGILGVGALAGACYFVFCEFGFVAGGIFTAVLVTLLILYHQDKDLEETGFGHQDRF